VVEVFVRGLWIARCATKIEIASFKKGRIDKGFEVLTHAVERSIGHPTRTLVTLKAEQWKAMKDFTDTGLFTLRVATILERLAGPTVL
jgi:hypothetical protein